MLLYKHPRLEEVQQLQPPTKKPAHPKTELEARKKCSLHWNMERMHGDSTGCHTTERTYHVSFPL